MRQCLVKVHQVARLRQEERERERWLEYGNSGNHLLRLGCEGTALETVMISQSSGLFSHYPNYNCADKFMK